METNSKTINLKNEQKYFAQHLRLTCDFHLSRRKGRRGLMSGRGVKKRTRRTRMEYMQIGATVAIPKVFLLLNSINQQEVGLRCFRGSNTTLKEKWIYKEAVQVVSNLSRETPEANSNNLSLNHGVALNQMYFQSSTISNVKNNKVVNYCFKLQKLSPPNKVDPAPSCKITKFNVTHLNSISPKWYEILMRFLSFHQIFMRSCCTDISYVLFLCTQHFGYLKENHIKHANNIHHFFSFDLLHY